jgi:hypothetical protein
MANIVDPQDTHAPSADDYSSASLESYVLSMVQGWEDHLEANYYRKWDEYYRLWRGQWAAEDKVRDTERSKIVTPALQQAVESSVSEIEEATFGKGKWFDIRDDLKDPEQQDVAQLRAQLLEDLEKYGARRDISECILNAAVFGTGIGEVVVEEVKEMAPGSQPIMDGQMKAIGTFDTERPVVKLRPIHPKTFRIDPVATTLKEAHGCAIDEFVPRHTVEAAMRAGVYRMCDIGNAPQDQDLEPDPQIDAIYHDEKVRLTKYFGLVPRFLLEQANQEDDDEEIEDLFGEETQEDSWDLVEAVVVIANEGTLLKAEASPYMMQDRPLVAFSWDTVPGLFWGRGVCEKGYNSQKALDAEIRGRIDALALTVHPMLAMDATRIPRGHKPQIRPGKLLLTNGNPSEVLHPFNFGQVQQVTFAQAEALQQMVQQSTGAVDSTGIVGQVNGEATAAGISMSLGAIIKRQKRTLINFQNDFLIPFVEKAAYRYMQFDPDTYNVADYKFIATSTLGVIAREYEVGQLTQLLQVMKQDSPAYPALTKAIVENMNTSNRDELIQILDAATNPSQEEMDMIKRAQENEMRLKEAQIQVFEAQAEEFRAEAKKHLADAEATPVEAKAKVMAAAARDTNRDDQSEGDFERRLKIAQFRLEEQKVGITKRQADAAAEAVKQRTAE